MSFIQINLQGSKSATSTLMGFANKNKILILLLQDFYHFNEEIWSIPKNWQAFTSKNKTAAIIVTRKDIEAIQTYKDDNTVFVNTTSQWDLHTQNLKGISDRI